MTIKVGPRVAAVLILLCAASPAVAGPLEDGETAIRKGDYSTAMTRLTPLAERGDKEAQYEVGRMYEAGEGVTKDYAKAASWYQKSSLGGDHRAQLLLSLMYARGQGVQQNDKQGLYWLSKATADDPAQKQMAAKSLYYQVRGSFDQGRQLSISELTARALPWLQQQADHGDNYAKCALLQLYETGQAVARKSEDMASLHRTCAAMRYESSSHPAIPALNHAWSQSGPGPALPTIPALPVPPPIMMLNFPNPDSALVVGQPTDKQIADAGSSLAGQAARKLAFVLCQIQPDGSLGGCTVSSEFPDGSGLGNAGLRLAKLVRMKTENQQGISLVGHRVQARFAFQGS